ncbi:DDE superfamily endonuclease containing protein [Trichomonas vaginalis G3]|uniref:DDE superfamily endonuclease containing protein n=1 Tax=Trichomonas vaginalis (strain ATCC PRA-98 / G3) TaxID=412133 RepID=A2HQX0_TRIV3|nr:DDE superfamily endonuclease containing protein [Trichomonas vaginalis G3]|eukprot:XP_001281127.1 DDE superfamily endonuclease containing protein [Trichomonas vaginalis G3]
MDETMLYSKRRYKVLTAGRNRPVRAEKSQLPHLTGVCTIFADGTTMKPMVILPQKKTLDAELEDLDAFFVRSESGWMNKYLFMVYCIMFICKVQEKRSQMNVFDAQVPFLLIVDGHPSRLSFLAVRLLSAFNIELLVLPGHTSHILQPLDVGIFSPLKAQFKKLFDMAVSIQVLGTAALRSTLPNTCEFDTLQSCQPLHLTNELTNVKNKRSHYRSH